MSPQKKTTYLKRGLTAAAGTAIAVVFAATVFGKLEGQTVILSDGKVVSTLERYTAVETEENIATAEPTLTESESYESQLPQRSNIVFEFTEEAASNSPEKNFKQTESELIQTESIKPNSSASENRFEPEEISASDSSEVTGSSSLVNINTAGLEELKSLNGIGDVKAQAVIDYRNTHGLFRSVEQITEVSGIGEKTLEKIRAFITV